MNVTSSWFVACSLILTTSGAMAFEDLGSVEAARRDHPNIFVPEEVSVVDVNSVVHYVFSGQAEKCFSEETDSELWEEASMAAKNVFYAHLSDGKDGVRVSMSGCEPLYRLRDGNVFTMIMCVPRDKVVITTENPVATDAPADEAVQKPDPQTAAEVSACSLTSVSVAPAANDEKAGSGDGVSSPSDEIVRDLVVEVTSSVQDEVPVDIDLRISRLRERLDANPDDWRVRRRLAKLFAVKGDGVKAAKFYDSAARGALRDEDILEEERVEVVYEAACACEAGSQMHLALKYYRMLLHMKVSFEIRKAANARVSGILLKDPGA